ncbi:hypothetical protein CCMA1212_009894 [Trichoderma ghanense]|uniref:BTB domain-containing protein n=1 Tax=Trichoderma ghanense TaxID=65468 RepID=A0ABY2GRW0_9HYPO
MDANVLIPRTSSPYAIPSATLQLTDGSRLYVPAHLLAKSERLSSLGRDGELQIDVSHDVAHVLVHYLFTNDYQCLRPKGSSPNQRLVAEFETSIRVYIAAREYKLPLLEELAKAEITKLGSEFRIPFLFDVVKKAYPHPNEKDTWLRQFLQSRLRTLFTDPKELLEWEPIPEEKPTTVSDILLKDLFQILRENLISDHKISNGIHPEYHSDTSQKEPVTAANKEQLELDESEEAQVAADAKITNGSVKHEVDAENGDWDATKHDVGLAKGEASIIRSDSYIDKSETNTSKSDDEATRNGVHTPVSKADSCEPQISKVEQPSNGVDLVVKPTEEKKDDKDFWGLSLKKKKKKKAAKPFVPESLHEVVTVKP